MLAVRRGGLGDTLLFVPVLRALRRAHPAAPLHFAGVREFAEVLSHFGVVDAALSVEDLQVWSLGSDGDVAQRSRARLGSYARIVGDDAGLLVVGDAVPVQRFDPRPQRGDLPLAPQIAAQLGLALAPSDVAPIAVARVRSDGPVVLAPGSGAMAKNWPRVHWLELAASLDAANAEVAVVVGPTEVERDDPRAWPWPAPVAFCAGRTPVQLAEYLATARAFVGNDSGPAHLAAALSVPSVVVFGTGMPQVFAPPFAHVRVVGAVGDGPPRVRVDEVAAALADLGLPLRAR